MKNNLQLISRVIGTELLKLRRTIALWLTILYPLGTVILASLFLFAMRKQADTTGVPFINNLNNVAAFFLPFYVVLTISFFCQLEHRNAMLKHLLSLPVPKWAYFYGKMVAAIFLMVAAWILMVCFTYLSFFLLGFIVPKLRLTGSFDHAYIFGVLTRSFLSATALLVIQYILSLKFRNVVASVAIGTALIILPIAVLFVLGITGIISNPRVLHWLPVYDPYSYPFAFVFNLTGGGLVKLDYFPSSLWTWNVIAVTLAAAGYAEFRNRNVK